MSTYAVKIPMEISGLNKGQYFSSQQDLVLEIRTDSVQDVRTGLKMALTKLIEAETRTIMEQKNEMVNKVARELELLKEEVKTRSSEEIWGKKGLLATRVLVLLRDLPAEKRGEVGEMINKFKLEYGSK